jgi:hypothetical protein
VDGQRLRITNAVGVLVGLAPMVGVAEGKLEPVAVGARDWVGNVEGATVRVGDGVVVGPEVDSTGGVSGTLSSF